MTINTPNRASASVAATLIVAAVALTGCQKTTTVEQTSSGTVTTTTIAPSASASAAMHTIDASLAKAASAVQSSAAASEALDKVSNAIEDGAITAEVKTALLADATVKAMRIDVDTKGGVVSLNGNVASDASRTRAERIARDARGVTGVENHLTVVPSQ